MDKKNKTDELIIANRELASQNEEKDKRIAELTIANKELEQFVYIVSHDLREPLRTISIYMQVFEEDYSGLLDENARKYLNSAKIAANRMRILIKSLLNFSRLGHNSKLTFVDCRKLINDVIADLEPIIQASNTMIEVAEMPALNLYEPEMHRVFQNLISNAIKFRKKDTRPIIRIRSEKMNGKWKFSVNDNGIGIDPANFEHIFVIFQRVHSNEEEYKGTGIGLASCKKIIQLHKGEIWVESTLGQGTTINFTIPNLTG
jgi:light-regulated signal transduction histidine kinase (bacteriophytochrome)